jgi:hypothetical protein
VPYVPGIEGDDYVSHLLVQGSGHLVPYNAERPAPVKRRKPGFITEDDYVRKGVVKEYKKKRRK